MGEDYRVTREVKVAVMGAGAIGSLLGGLLADAGNDVTLIGRQPHIEAVRRSGLRIKGAVRRLVRDIKARTEPGMLHEDICDLILLTVKAYDVEQAAAELRPARSIPILCLQNGIGVEGAAAKKLGLANLLRGVTHCGATLEAPGLIHCAGVQETLIGSLAAEGSEAVGMVAELFEKAGLPASITENIEGAVWSKTLVNAGINPYGTLMERRNGELLKIKGLKELMTETAKEGVEVAARLGVALEGDPIHLLFKTVKATASNLNSMLQDVRRGKRTEISFLNGAIAKLGGRVGVPTPLNSLLTILVQSVEAQR